MSIESFHQIRTGELRLHRNLCDQVVDHLGLRIVGGEFKPGDTLPDEETLRSEFGVSRSILREAIKSLSAKGIVEARPRHGTSVRPHEDWSALDPDVLAWRQEVAPKKELLDDLTELRTIIEPAAAELAARRATNKDILEIEDAFNAMESNVNTLDNFMIADARFHAAILTASHNEFFGPVGNVICAAMSTGLKITNRRPDENLKSLPLHRPILEAIKDRNPVAARDAMLQHLEETSRRIERVLSDQSS